MRGRTSSLTGPSSCFIDRAWRCATCPSPRRSSRRRERSLARRGPGTPRPYPLRPPSSTPYRRCRRRIRRHHDNTYLIVSIGEAAPSSSVPRAAMALVAAADTPPPKLLGELHFRKAYREQALLFFCARSRQTSGGKNSLAKKRKNTQKDTRQLSFFRLRVIAFFSRGG